MNNPSRKHIHLSSASAALHPTFQPIATPFPISNNNKNNSAFDINNITASASKITKINSTTPPPNTKKMMDLLSPNSSPSLATRKSKNLKNLQLNLSNSSSPRNASTISTYGDELTTTASSASASPSSATSGIPLPVQKCESTCNDQSSLSSSSVKTPITSRTPTPTGTTISATVSPFSHQRPLQHFRRMTSYNSTSPSNSVYSTVNGSFTNINANDSSNNTPLNANNQRKKSINTLALNIPVTDLGSNTAESGEDDVPASSIAARGDYGDFLLKEVDTTITTTNNSNTHNDTDKPTRINNKKIPVLPFEKPTRIIDNTDLNNNTTNQGSFSASPMSFHSPSNSISAKMLSPSLSAPVGINYSSEIKPQTIMHSFDESRIDETNNDNFKFAYPNGPICVLEPNLYLYSEPTFEEITDFDVIINVAQEIKDFSNQIDEINRLTETSSLLSTSSISSPVATTPSNADRFEDFEKISIDSQNREKLTLTKKNKKNIEYYFIPWTHTSRLTSDFPYLTSLIDKSLKSSKKVLIHCQCGVSRSASLIMAYFMKVFGRGYNDAYMRLKGIVPQISPNLSLIYELIEWGEWLEKGQPHQ